MQVYSFGCNDEGALGRDTSAEGSETVPGKVELQEKVVQVSAGDSHTAALTEDGRVFLWGSFRVRLAGWLAGRVCSGAGPPGTCLCPSCIFHWAQKGPQAAQGSGGALGKGDPSLSGLRLLSEAAVFLPFLPPTQSSTLLGERCAGGGSRISELPHWGVELQVRFSIKSPLVLWDLMYIDCQKQIILIGHFPIRAGFYLLGRISENIKTE